MNQAGRRVQSLRPPVLVIGATRSGTSLLAELLSSAHDACLWYEPNTVWRLGHAYRSHDAADAGDASLWVKRHIRALFLRYQEAHGGRRVVEKSPYNVLRIPFIHAVLPEARIVHIVRDGRANLSSQLLMLAQFEGYSLAERDARLHLVTRLGLTPWWEWPAYLPRAWSALWRRWVLRRPMAWWGLRYPGWEQDRHRPPAEVAARQWVEAVNTAQRALAALPRDVWTSVRYEDLISAPAATLQRLAGFCGLEYAPDRLAALAADVHGDSRDAWREGLPRAQLAQALSVMEPLLRELSYV